MIPETELDGWVIDGTKFGTAVQVGIGRMLQPKKPCVCLHRRWDKLTLSYDREVPVASSFSVFVIWWELLEPCSHHESDQKMKSEQHQWRMFLIYKSAWAKPRWFYLYCIKTIVQLINCQTEKDDTTTDFAINFTEIRDLRMESIKYLTATSMFSMRISDH